MEMLNILIIEDDSDYAFLEDDVLNEQLDCDVNIVTSRAALQKRAVLNADVVLLDFNLPDTTGAEILSDIRKWSDIPVLMVTGNEQLQIAVESLKGGAVDFVTKSPANIAQLPKLVLNAVVNYREHKQQDIQKRDQERKDTKIETLRQVLTTLAHYINNSTTTIYGYAQLYEQNKEDVRSCEKLAEVSIKETKKISFVLQELEEFVNTTEIKTTNYVNIPDAMFAIDENLKEKMENI